MNICIFILNVLIRTHLITFKPHQAQYSQKSKQQVRVEDQTYINSHTHISSSDSRHNTFGKRLLNFF